VLRSKMFWGAKYESAKCSGEQSVCQPLVSSKRTIQEAYFFQNIL
jgi:hypothetical protein